MGALKRALYRTKAQLSFLHLIKDPTDTPGIFRMTKSFQQSATPEILERMVGLLMKDEALQEAWQQRYWVQIPKLSELRRYPEGSFGREAAAFFDRWNLDSDLFPDPNFETTQDYITSRFYQAHDFWHVLTGYTPELVDELALQAFGVAQYRQAVGLVIIAGGSMHILQKHPERADEILRAISEGFHRGQQCQPLLSVPVLERLNEPLEQVRRDLGLQPLQREISASRPEFQL